MIQTIFIGLRVLVALPLIIMAFAFFGVLALLEKCGVDIPFFV